MATSPTEKTRWILGHVDVICYVIMNYGFVRYCNNNIIRFNEEKRSESDLFAGNFILILLQLMATFHCKPIKTPNSAVIRPIGVGGKRR